MNGKIQVNSGDVSIIAVNVDGVANTSIPAKNSGKNFQKADCTNGATGSWDRSNWRFLLSGLTQTKTKCTLYFVTGQVTGEQSCENKMEDLLENDKNQVKPSLVSDDNNIRYIGSNPNNYVKFNNETWRIIGLMDGIQTKDHGTQRLLKIIREKLPTSLSWDSSVLSVNSGYGVNEWSQADLMTVLNGDYFYGRNGSDKCYNNYNETTTTCPDWTQVGLKTEAQNMVEEVTWNTGTSIGTESVWRAQNFTPQQYMWERSTNHGKQCSSSSSSCNDGVTRQTTWTGKVGLMYPSDYGYATDGGGDLMKRGQCLYTPLYSWDNSSYSYCKDNDWLFYSNNYQWTMTPAPDSSYASNMFLVCAKGFVSGYKASIAYAVRPVVYLKSSVKIIGGTGEEGSPFELKLE